MRPFALQQPRVRQGNWMLPAALTAVVAAGWAWSLQWTAAGHHRVHGVGLAGLFAMWAAMSVAMMVPVEMASLLRAARTRPAVAHAGAFLGGYLLPWMAFSAGAALLQQRLHHAGWIDAEMALRGALPCAALLAVAGLLQLSPLRRECLSRCRAASLEVGRGGVSGGARAGVASIACCGLLMLVPFATGAMSIGWMVALTALLVIEREFPRAERAGVAAGLLLLALAIWKLAA
jgi:predicted metal-binding membrane protein